MRAKTLLVFGCGPKALALAAKARSLREAQFDVPDVIIIERDEIAAHWTGRAGYTDGTHPLGTAPEKDVGFPYASTFGSAIDERMLRYSWHSFLVADGAYADWIDRGKPHPPHWRWSTYFSWVAQQLDVQPILGTVVHIDTYGTQWQLKYRKPNGTERSVAGDGLVITGPGDPVTLEGQPLNNERVFDGKTFWRRINEFDGLDGVEIAVVGSGETAAAVVVALTHRVSHGAAIYVINRQGAVFTRGESYDENSLYSDPSSWEEMDIEDRREFIARTDRGVFSVKTKSVIDHAENVMHKLMDVRRMEVKQDGVVLHGKPGKNLRVDYVVNTTAFDPLWFRRLAASSLRRKLSRRSYVEQSIEHDLAAGGIRPRLHLPMLAALSQGPGFPNLSSLGLLSDRILESYCSARLGRQNPTCKRKA